MFAISVTAFLMAISVHSRDVKPQEEIYMPDYNFYHNLSRIESHLLELVQNNQNVMKMDWSYRSKQNRPQYLVRVSNFSSEGWTYTAGDSIPRTHQKVKILLSYGEHAREFFPVESMFNLLTNLTQGLSSSKDSEAWKFSRHILSNIDLYIVPMMNPDGRQFIENTRNYCWRGTSTGVDINRNFDWRFGEKGSSSYPDDEEYRGPTAFSEPECLILVELTSKIKFDVFISLHSGIRQIYVPYADTISKRERTLPSNTLAMLELAEKMSMSTSSDFKYGTAYKINDYTADGTIFDYMSGVRNIPFSYAIELWGNDKIDGAKCFDTFNPRSANLQAEVANIGPLYTTLFEDIIRWKKNKIDTDKGMQPPSLELHYILLSLLVLLAMYVALYKHLPQCMRTSPVRRVISLRSLSSSFKTFAKS